MKLKKYIVSVYGNANAKDIYIRNAINDALQRETRYHKDSEIYACIIMVNPYK